MMCLICLTIDVQAQVIFRPGNGLPPNFPGVSSPSGSSGPSSSGSDSGNKGDGPWIPSQPLAAASGTNLNTSTNEIQLSFQSANIDTIVQWLAQTTGKSIIKHPQVQCQLTINSSKKVSEREALNLVYRALALEGFSVIEFSDSILIVPQGKEPRMSPEILDSSHKQVPAGRQRLVKVFRLKHIQAADLKQRIQSALTDTATIDVDPVANQLIISDYNDNIRAVSDLIQVLDTEKPEDMAVRVIPLKNVSATDLVKEIAPLYDKKNAGSLKDTFEITADEQSNALLIFSSAANFRAIQDFVASLDTEDSQDKIMRTFPLKNADAQDVAQQLQDLNQEQNVNARYYFNYGGSSGKSRKMTVVADRRRNAVIVQAPPSQMEGIGKMIQELDAPVDDGSLAPKIYPLKYVNAADIEDVLNELFSKKTQQRNYWDYVFGDDNGDSSSSGNDVGRLYGKVRITSEPYSNAIIVTANSKENLAVVENVIKQLDAPSEANESTLRIGLKFAKASEVANNINILFAKNGAPPLRPVNQNGQQQGQNPQPQQQQSSTAQSAFDLEQETKEEGYYPWLGGQPDNPNSSSGRSSSRPVSDLVDRIRAVADPRSNALLISANVHFFPEILKLIDELDVPTPQVLIDARLVEVSSDFLDQLGVRWSPNGSQEFTGDDYDNSILANATASYMKGFGGNTTVNSPAVNTVAQALTSLRSGVLSSSISMDFLIQFLHRTTDATVLAEPQINVSDNETGRLFVGQQVPILTAQNNPALGGTSQNFEYKDVGVILEVTPHINVSGDVELKLHAESSTVVPGQTVLGGSVFNTRNFRTDLTAKNGQTLVVGGIIQKQVSTTLRKTPILGSIPGLGWAFKKKDQISQEVELLVFLRPRVVRSDRDARGLMKEMEQKTPLIKKWQDESEPKDKKEKKGK